MFSNNLNSTSPPQNLTHFPSLKNKNLFDSSVFGTVAQSTPNKQIIRDSSNQVVIQEDTLERDDLQRVDLDQFSPQKTDNVPLSERVRYVYRCLGDVKVGLQPFRTELPKDEIAYAIHAVDARNRRNKQLTEDVDKQLIQQSLQEERERLAPTPVNDNSDEQQIALEDTINTNSDKITRSAKLTVANNLEDAKLVDFEERLEYVYRCLKQLQDKKLDELRREREHINRYGNAASHHHFSVDSEDALYELALKQTKSAIETVTKGPRRSKL